MQSQYEHVIADVDDLSKRDPKVSVPTRGRQVTPPPFRSAMYVVVRPA